MCETCHGLFHVEFVRVYVLFLVNAGLILTLQLANPLVKHFHVSAYNSAVFQLTTKILDGGNICIVYRLQPLKLLTSYPAICDPYRDGSTLSVACLALLKQSFSQVAGVALGPMGETTGKLRGE